MAKFEKTAAVLAGAGASAAGRSRLPIRLMVGLLYLKHAYNESDEVRPESRLSFCSTGGCLA